MEVKIENSWKEQLKEEFDKDYFKKLADFVKTEYETQTIFPLGKDIFKAFDKCSFEDVKVVLLGQDPYHGAGQANGLCFSVSDEIKKIPPSLKNIFKEINADLGKEIPTNGNLERWAEQGVLLLNATLTVRESSAGSHQKKGWEQFTDAVIKAVNDQSENVVFILWGSYAHKKGAIIDDQKHHVIKSAHPSPLSARNGFFGSQPFSKTNTYLESLGKEPINW